MMGVTLSDCTILVNLPTPVGKEKVNAFSCDTKALLLLDWAMRGEKLSMLIFVPRPSAELPRTSSRAAKRRGDPDLVKTLNPKHSLSVGNASFCKYMSL